MLRSIEIKEGAFIGANAMLLPGTVIGKGSIIGSGSVVKGIIPDNVVVVGNPAKIIKTTEEYYIKIKEKEFENIRFW